MTVVYILSHFDDEYCALPLLVAHRDAGDAQHFLYVTDYGDGAERRRQESADFLSRWGVDPAGLEHVGRGAGVMDGASHLTLNAAYERVKARLLTLGPISKLVTPAWEGGHMDHDACAALTVRLAAELGVPQVEQFSLYNGPGLYGRLFRAAHPLAENGPVRRVPFSARDLARWAGHVRLFPSQAKTWIGLWPVMFLSLMVRGFGVQTLTASRVRERPHAGPLLYERMYGTSFAEVHAVTEAFLAPLAAPERVSASVPRERVG